RLTTMSLKAPTTITAEIAYKSANMCRWFEHNFGSLEEIAISFEAVADLHSVQQDIQAETAKLGAERDQIKSAITDLNSQRTKLYAETSAIVPETQAQAKTILDAANAKA